MFHVFFSHVFANNVATQISLFPAWVGLEKSEFWSRGHPSSGEDQTGLWFYIVVNYHKHEKNTHFKWPSEIVDSPIKKPWMVIFHSCNQPWNWVNYNISLTWIKAIWEWFPLLTMIPVRSQWGRYNLPRWMVIFNSYVELPGSTWFEIPSLPRKKMQAAQ